MAKLLGKMKIQFSLKTVEMESVVKHCDYENQGKSRFTPPPRGLAALHCIMNNTTKSAKNYIAGHAVYTFEISLF